MILEKAYYQQNFQVGQFLFANYGLGAFIEEGETHQEVYAQLKERVYAQFRSDNPHLDFGPTTQSSEPIQRDISNYDEYVKTTHLPERQVDKATEEVEYPLIDQMKTCVSPVVFKIYKNLVKTDEEKEFYEKRMEELLNQPITNGNK